MIEEPVGLATSKAFLEYIEELREMAPFGDESPPEHVSRDGNANANFSTMATQSDSDEESKSNNELNESPDAADLLERNITKRRFMQGVGAAAIAATAGAGAVSAQTEKVPDFLSELTPAPWIEGKYGIAEQTPEMDALGFIDDESNETSLAEFGAVVAPREDADPDVDATPHNPYRFSADGLETAEYTDFPRGIIYEDVYADANIATEDEGADIRIVDAEHWTTSGMVVENDGRGIRFSGVDLDTATFDKFETLGSPARRMFQVVVNVANVDAGAVMSFVIEDSSGNTVTTKIDAAGDRAANDHVIAASTGDGYVIQPEIGTLTGGDALEDISTIRVEVSGGAVDATVYGFNLDKSSKWSFGTREFLDADSNIDTKTVREPAGMTGITSVTGLDDSFGSATRHGVEVDLELRADELPADALDLDVTAVERYDRPKRYQLVGGFEIPTGYDLTPQLTTMYGKARHSSSRYLEVGFETGRTELPDLGDIENDNLSLTDRTTSFENGDFDNLADVEITTAGLSADIVAFYYDLNVEDSSASEMARTPGGGGGVAPAESGGIMTSMRGWALAIITGIVGTVGAIKAGIIGGD